MAHLTAPKHWALESSLYHWLRLVFLFPKWLINNNKMRITCEWPTPVGTHASFSLGLCCTPAAIHPDPEMRVFGRHRVRLLAQLSAPCHKNLDSLHKVHFSCYCSANHILSYNFRMWQDKIGNINAISPPSQIMKMCGRGGGHLRRKQKSICSTSIPYIAFKRKQSFSVLSTSNPIRIGLIWWHRFQNVIVWSYHPESLSALCL